MGQVTILQQGLSDTRVRMASVDASFEDLLGLAEQIKIRELTENERPILLGRQ
jgi:hypothetical protein